MFLRVLSFLCYVAAFGFSLFNLFYIVINFGWQSLIPWEYYYKSFAHLAPLVVISNSFTTLADIFDPGDEPRAGLLILLIFHVIVAVIALALYFSWAFFFWYLFNLVLYFLYAINIGDQINGRTI